MSSTHINFRDVIPDLDLNPELNSYSLEHGETAVHMDFGALRLTLTDADETQQIADAFTEAARLLREAEATIAARGDEALS